MKSNTEGVSFKSDLEKFIQLYQSIGIKCRPEQNDKGEFVLSFGKYCGNSPNYEKFGGYSGFYTSIFFDAKGRFITQLFVE